MDEVVATYPKTRLEVILDNLSTHKKNEAWLARHPLVTFHYTPTRASWLNQVEGWFSILQGKSLTGASFTSVEQLKEHIDAFINADPANEPGQSAMGRTAHPFATIGFDLLYALVIVRLERRDLVWINVTPNPTAEWIARQITEALPWDEAPRYLIRDRDLVYGSVVTRRLRAMGIRDKPIAPGSPWQNGFAERLIGSIRRECTDHVVALGEAHLRQILKSYARYYSESRTHRSLNKDAPVHRAIERIGAIISRPILGGLHHRYCRI
jgi:hypothetical protein